MYNGYTYDGLVTYSRVRGSSPLSGSMSILLLTRSTGTWEEGGGGGEAEEDIYEKTCRMGKARNGRVFS